MRGLVENSARWALYERVPEARFHVLDVKESPSSEDLVAEMATKTGLPIAEALIDEARRRLPSSVFTDS
jgi:hypothetical protein